jgi:hypothetical protein
MHVLGLFNALDPSTADPSWLCATMKTTRQPKITCAQASSVQLILYDRPRPIGMQYISLQPIELALGRGRSRLEDTSASGSKIDLDQLLVGTILFTLLFFLLPTVVVFYLNFAVARMIIISMKAGFDTLLSCLNHFPLFALMLRLKDPRRLPGGIQFELRDTHDDRITATPNTLNEPPTSVIYLKVNPQPSILHVQAHSSSLYLYSSAPCSTSTFRWHIGYGSTICLRGCSSAC